MLPSRQSCELNTDQKLKHSNSCSRFRVLLEYKVNAVGMPWVADEVGMTKKLQVPNYNKYFLKQVEGYFFKIDQ